MALGAYFKTLRLGRDLHQADLAERLSLRLGRSVDKSTVWRMEKGRTMPSGPILSAVLGILGGDITDVNLLRATPDNIEEGKRLARIRLTEEQVARADQMIDETPDEVLDEIFDELRDEARATPALLSHLRTFLAGWRANRNANGDADQSH